MQTMQEAQIVPVDTQKKEDITQELKNTFRRNRYASFQEFWSCLEFFSISTFKNFKRSYENSLF